MRKSRRGSNYGDNEFKKNNKMIKRLAEDVESRRKRKKRGEGGEKDNIRLSNFQMISNETQSALASCQLSLPLCNRALKLD